MTEYIEREALIAEFEWLKSIEYPYQRDRTEDALQRIKNAPVADVALVRHGHWVSLTDCSNAGVYCSICHKKVYKEDYAWCNRKNKIRSPYCPNCGAKMDGGEYNA